MVRKGPRVQIPKAAQIVIYKERNARQVHLSRLELNFKMAKKKAARTMIHLECTVCHERNYHSEKSKTTTPNRLELNKFCKRCGKVTLHKEGK